MMINREEQMTVDQYFGTTTEENGFDQSSSLTNEPLQ